MQVLVVVVMVVVVGREQGAHRSQRVPANAVDVELWRNDVGISFIF